MYEVLLIINLVTAVALIGAVLIQHGRGAEMGSSFGRGAAGSLVGVTGSANFITRVTSGLATVFFSTALGLSLLSVSDVSTSLVDKVEQVSAGQNSEQPASLDATSEVPLLPYSSSEATTPSEE